MRRRTPLTLVSNADGQTGRAATRLLNGGLPIPCPVCTERLGIHIDARLTMLPTKARLDRTGKLVLDEQILVCAQCQKQGIITRF